MNRDQKPSIPVELRDADELLYKYGQWAQDRYKKQHCASIEHKYKPPINLDDEPLIPFIADHRALEIQHTLVVVPMQYRRVLQAFYIPQRLPTNTIRRMHNIPTRTWESSHLIGLRMFWGIYTARYLKKNRQDVDSR